MECMKRIVTGLGLEEKGEETGDRVAELGEAEKCEGVMTPDNNIPVSEGQYTLYSNAGVETPSLPGSPITSLYTTKHQHT